MLRRRELMAMQENGRLPKEYMEIEYLTSDGGAYIDLPTVSFGAGDSIRSTIKFSYQGTRTNNFWVAGDGGVKGGIQYEYGYYFRWWFLGNTGSTSTITGTGVNALCEVDWVHVYASAANNYGFRVFQRSGGFPAETDKRDIYYLKYWKNSMLLNDLIPCIRKSDSKPGMYDTVSKTFYTNAGAGEFIVPA